MKILKDFVISVHCRWFPPPNGYRYDPYWDQSDVRHVSAPKTQQTVCVRLSGGGHYHPLPSEQVSRTFYSFTFPLGPSCESYCQNEGEKCRQFWVRSSETTEVIEWVSFWWMTSKLSNFKKLWYYVVAIQNFFLNLWDSNVKSLSVNHRRRILTDLCNAGSGECLFPEF